MKFLTSLLLLTSFSTFASNLSLQESLDSMAYEFAGEEPIKENINEVKKALYTELYRGTFNCKVDTKSGYTLDYIKSYFSSYVYANSNSTLSLATANTGPEVTAIYVQGSVKWIFKFKLDASMREVTGIDMIYEGYTVEEKNNGTIVKPRFEKVNVMTANYITTCKR